MAARTDWDPDVYARFEAMRSRPFWELADLIIANASLQWVPDHPAVLGRWCSSLAHGGQLVVQVPANADHPSHTCSAAVAQHEPFVTALAGTPRSANTSHTCTASSGFSWEAG